MKHDEKKPRHFVDSFLAELGEPLSELHREQATADVLERLRADEVPVLNAPVVFVSRKSRTWGWGAIAAAVLVMLAGGMLQMIPLRLSRVDRVDAVAKSVRGELHQAGVASPLRLFTVIEAGRVLRAGNGGGAIALLDGSQIDMSPNAALSIVREADGLLVQLSSGTVLVTAAKQHDGHLYVETKDCLVSVVGTVFAVSAEESGSRVSVIEGEVHVQRGDISQTLLAGQQASTSPTLGPFPADTGNGWVEPQRLALLQQPTPPPPQTPAVDSGVTLRGVVSQTSTGMGIPDVMVTLCPASAGTRVRFVPPVDRLNQGNVETPGQFPLSGPVIKNKKIFFALWDGAVCQTPPGVKTDSSGRFQFQNVAPGEYVVTAERDGYAGASTNGPIGTSTTNKGIFYFVSFNAQPVEVRNLLGAERQNVTVEAQNAPQEVSLTMTRAGVIAGHVRDADGKLLVNAQVRIVALPVQGAPGDEITVAGATTNDLGEYRAYWVLPGEYRVVATGPAGRLSAETWFPRGASAGEASSVSIREGEEVSSIDIILRPALPSDTPVVPAGPGLRFQSR